MSVFKRFVMWRKARARMKCIQSLRGHLISFGYDTSGMTDEELEEHVVFAGKQIAKTGVTAQQAADGLRAIASISAAT